jgi:hypothetical protein
MAGIRSFGQYMDQDNPVASLQQVVGRPPRRSLARRRVVHADGNCALRGCHGCVRRLSFHVERVLEGSVTVNEGGEAAREQREARRSRDLCNAISEKSPAWAPSTARF